MGNLEIVTPEQIDDWLGHYADQTVTRIQTGFREIAAANAHRGTLGSGAYIKERLAFAAIEIGELVKRGLAEAEAVERAGGNSDHLYDGLSAKIVQCSLFARDALKLEPPFYQPSAKTAARELAMEDVVRLQAEVRHHRTGFGRQNAGQITGSVIIKDSPGSSVQHSSPGATQSNDVIVSAVATALTQAEAALPWCDLPSGMADEIRADLETIKAQLRKPKPSIAIMQEAGSTVRSLLENVAGGVLTPAAITTLAMLWRSLGL